MGLLTPMKHIYSYKYHVRGKDMLPPEASVICFHGDPKPDDVGEEWVQEAYQ